MKKLTSLLAFLVFGGAMTFAQTAQEVSDQEVKQFASAFQEIQLISQQAQQEMTQVVEEKGLNVERYTEIQKAEQDPNQEVKATAAELKNYETANVELEKIQVQAQQKMQEKIAAENLTIERYQEIVAQIQTNPDLQQKIQGHLQQGG